MMGIREEGRMEADVVGEVADRENDHQKDRGNGHEKEHRNDRQGDPEKDRRYDRIDEHESHAGNWLAIDTSTSAMTLAVLNGETVLGESNLHAVRNHSTLLIPAIHELVRSLDMTMGDIQGIAAGKGPGSYTGVRIGVTAAKTLAWALGCRLIGVSSLEAMAYGGFCDYGRKQLDEAGLSGQNDTPPSEQLNMNGSPPSEQLNMSQWVVPLIDGRRNQVFTGLYASDGKKWSCLADDSIRLMSEWAEALVYRYFNQVDSREEHVGVHDGMGGHDEQDWRDGRSGRPERIIIVGEVEPFGDDIDQIARLIDCTVVMQKLEIRARDVGFLGLTQWGRGDRQDVHGFIPNYAQLTEAEKNLLKRGSELVRK